jgi:TatD DNase family protein
MFFDSHCHLTDERFTADLPATLERARAADVRSMVTIGSDLEDSRRAAQLAAAERGLWASVGVHPHVADAFDADQARQLDELARSSGVVAIGETGLDYHYGNSAMPAQRDAFERQLQLAAGTGLPVVVHSRDADADTIAMLEAAPPGVTGVLHCFAGGPELLEAGLRCGFFVSFSGLVSFRSFAGADLLRRVPLDRLLIETDSPYLAPVPLRGRRNEPAFLPHVAAAVAVVLGVSSDVVATATAENARRLYRLSP